MVLKPIIKCRMCGAIYTPDVGSPSIDVLQTYLYQHACDERFTYRRGIGDIVGFETEVADGSSRIQDSELHPTESSGE